MLLISVSTPCFIPILWIMCTFVSACAASLSFLSLSACAVLVVSFSSVSAVAFRARDEEEHREKKTRHKIHEEVEALVGCGEENTEKMKEKKA